ncbi:MAG: alpha/beta fold hydrolase [Flavisolibacter sp.]
MERKTILFQNSRITYLVIGEGNPVLLIHGFGEDSSIWNNQYNKITGFKFIIADLPGSGDSDLISDMTMEGMAEVLYSILMDEKAQKASVTLIGHSMGGYIALAFVEKYPQMLKGFGLFHSTSYADTEQKVEIRKKGIQFIKEHGAYEFLKTSIPNLYSPVTKENNKQLIEEQIENSRNFTTEALVYYYEAMIRRPDRRHLLEKSQIPVLFILGKYDTAVPLNDGLEQCKLPEISYIHILDNSGHMGMREEVSESNKYLSAFLNTLYFT